MTMPIQFTQEAIGWYFFTGNDALKYPVVGLWPSTYLDFAKKDFDEEKSPRCWVNAVSNAKRALHYQVDALATALGWEHLKSRNDFPSKLNFLGSCGVLSPTIIKRMNRFRNTVEHDYYIPTENETLDYLEIVELYLSATHFITIHFPEYIDAYLMSDDDEYDPSWNYPEEIDISLPQGDGILTIKDNHQTLVQVAVSEPAYYEWVSAILIQSEL